MKILCIIDSLGSGGAQRQLVELAKGFKEKGHEVKFLTYHEINFFKPDLEEIGISVQTVVEPNYLKRFLLIRKLIRKEKPNAVLSFLEAANFIATCSGFPSRKWKLVVGERSANPEILKSIKLKFYRYFHSFADYVVANSFANLQMVEKINPFLPSHKKKVIYNIINNRDINTLQERGRVNRPLKIVVAASYRPVKNFDGLIEAINLLKTHDKEKINIEWYGNVEDKPYFENCLQKIQEYNLKNIINVNPATKEIFNKYQDADFVALLSHYEGFPNTICEAMILGKPILVSNISDIPLLVNENENGFTCNPEDILSIKKAIKNIIESTLENRQRMGTNNKSLALEKFNYNMIVDEYLELLGNGKN